MIFINYHCFFPFFKKNIYTYIYIYIHIFIYLLKFRQFLFTYVLEIFFLNLLLLSCLELVFVKLHNLVYSVFFSIANINVEAV